MIDDLFQTAALTAHGFCLAWQPGLLTLHVVSDLVIGLSYFSIPLTIAWFLARRRDLAFRGTLSLFVVFILACGTTHFLSIWTLWHPDYGVEGVVKAVTAIASVLTAARLWPLVPRALALPSPAALREANTRLLREAKEREAVVAALEQATEERTRTEAMLRQAQKMEAIGQLTGGIAHDFNNLLTVVTANLEILGRRLADEQLRRYVDRALKGASRGAVLTQQLLAFARRQPLKSVALDAGTLVQSLVALLPGTLGRGIALEVQVAPDLWQVEADPNQLESALLNLALNARDAMPAGGRLTITLANRRLEAANAAAMGDFAAGDYVTIAVVDTGVGMPPEVRLAAFEPFFTTKPVGSGSGLGLSQVYGFVIQSRGHVALDSTPGLGTTVTLTMRRAASSADHDSLAGGHSQDTHTLPDGEIVERGHLGPVGHPPVII